MSKRVFDIAIGLTIVAFMAPLLVMLAVLIRLQDGAPALLVQTRVGRYGREFKMFKFRSMRPNSNEQLVELLARNRHRRGVTFKMKSDPRVTPLGKWIRKLSLDELPQLFNVIIGHMSLVGPRPPLPREVELYSQAERLRLEMPPGLTCLWQISGRGDLDFTEQLRLDLQYIENQSFWGDVWILVRTIPAVFSCRGAY